MLNTISNDLHLILYCACMMNACYSYTITIHLVNHDIII